MASSGPSLSALLDQVNKNMKHYKWNKLINRLKVDKLEREVKNLGREVDKGEEYVRTLEEMIDRWAE